MGREAERKSLTFNGIALVDEGIPRLGSAGLGVESLVEISKVTFFLKLIEGFSPSF
jgi:hypothetical protein